MRLSIVLSCTLLLALGCTAPRASSGRGNAEGGAVNGGAGSEGGGNGAEGGEGDQGNGDTTGEDMAAKCSWPDGFRPAGTCGDILVCIGGCASDQLCVECCVAEGAPSAQRYYGNLMGCAVQNSCDTQATDTSCLVNNCAAEAGACDIGDGGTGTEGGGGDGTGPGTGPGDGTGGGNAGGASCRDSIMCMQACGENNNCYMDCINAASEDALLALSNIFGCQSVTCGEFGPEDPGMEGCITEECAPYFQGCMMGGPVELSCPGLFGCMDMVCTGMDQNCFIDKCVGRASVEASGQFSSLTGCLQENCGDVNPRDEAAAAACSEQHCSAEFTACSGRESSSGPSPPVETPPSSCDEVFACALDCQGDLSCERDCEAEATRQALDAYDALVGCIDSDCAGDWSNGGCIGESCPEEAAGCGLALDGPPAVPTPAAEGEGEGEGDGE